MRKVDEGVRTLYIYLNFNGVLTTKFSVPYIKNAELEFDADCEEDLKAVIKELSKYMRG